MEKILVQFRLSEQDGRGGIVDTYWQDMMTTYAIVEKLGHKDRIWARAAQMLATHRLLMDYQRYYYDWQSAAWVRIGPYDIMQNAYPMWPRQQRGLPILSMVQGGTGQIYYDMQQVPYTNVNTLNNFRIVYNNRVFSIEYVEEDFVDNTLELYVFEVEG